MAEQQGVTLNRAIVAEWVLQGEGIEIGALHQPLPLPPGARVKYVDRLTREQLRQQYPELNELPLVEPEIIDDGETLSTVASASQDFVVANHFLEHCQDPIGALQTLMRVLKPGGFLYMVIPDKLHTFDQDRPSTPLEHLIRDHEEGPAWSRTQHFLEWAEKVDKHAAGEAAQRRAQTLMDKNYSIHFHVWTKDELLAMLAEVNRRYALGFDVRMFVNNGVEGIYVLGKLSDGKIPVSILRRPKTATWRLWARVVKSRTWAGARKAG